VLSNSLTQLCFRITWPLAASGAAVPSAPALAEAGGAPGRSGGAGQGNGPWEAPYGGRSGQLAATRREDSEDEDAPPSRADGQVAPVPQRSGVSQLGVYEDDFAEL
jgi:hypothetical protein